MPRKTNKDKEKGGRRSSMESRTPRPKPKIDFTVDALDYKNVTLLRQFVTDAGQIHRASRALSARVESLREARAPDAADEVITTEN